MEYTQMERAVLQEFIFRGSVLRSAIEKFCEEAAAEANAECANAMRTVPRRYEHASDQAAKAEAYTDLLTAIERRCEKFAE
jgi:hypothetical protein